VPENYITGGASEDYLLQVQPTQIYEILAGLAIFAFLWFFMRKRVRRPGDLFAWFLILGGAERFLVEFPRVVPQIVGPLSGPALLGLAEIAAGVVWLVLSSRREAIPLTTGAETFRERERAVPAEIDWDDDDEEETPAVAAAVMDDDLDDDGELVSASAATDDDLDAQDDDEPVRVSADLDDALDEEDAVIRDDAVGSHTSDVAPDEVPDPVRLQEESTVPGTAPGDDTLVEVDVDEDEDTDEERAVDPELPTAQPAEFVDVPENVPGSDEDAPNRPA
jgi:hypothetical protein